MGIINGIVRKIQQGHRRDFEIMEEMYHEQKMKRDYYRTAKCPRSRGGGVDKCAFMVHYILLPECSCEI